MKKSGIYQPMVLIALTLLILVPFTDSEACTRFVYKKQKGKVITGRSMDFSIPIPGNLWIFPRDMQRNGETGEKSSVSWTSKYGSVVITSWDIGVPDGMNEKGLMANMLYLTESEYPEFEKNGDKKGLAVSLWAQYALDNFATVAEAVEDFSKEHFVVVTDYLPGTNSKTTIHLSLSDATGDNAILEYIGGKLYIYHSRDYNVMTNSPTFDKQLAINGYWNQVNGFEFLPGTNKAADRFARANFYLKYLPEVDSTHIATATVFSLIRQLSVPYGIQSGHALDLSTTRWRVVANQTDLIYYYEDVLYPNTIWVDLKKIDFSPSSGVRKLPVMAGQPFSGDVTSKFMKAVPFRFQGI